ncbi:Xaa-Pro aminopeptidase 3 [Nymphon striatum]|nr:Xaa-Pro aminopeptidase 3 [Nymphon striatum]
MQCKDGELILLDVAAEYANYSSDLTRTLPINGKFTSRQKDVYNAVLRVKNEATKLLVPGTIWAEFHKECGKIMTSELLGLGLLDKTDEPGIYIPEENMGVRLEDDVVIQESAPFFGREKIKESEHVVARTFITNFNEPHNDGKKIDLSFIYTDGGKLSNKKPSISGYGFFEGPKPNEYDQIKTCLDRGNWQYDFTKYFTFGTINSDLNFSEGATKDLILEILKQPSTGKLFVEPHLKTRLNLKNQKIRFHGCQAVRHDDHIHFQLK